MAGYLAECSLTTLKQLYNQIFNADIDVNTEHENVISSMVLIVSKSSGVTLYGSLSVDKHEAAKAFIHIGAGAIKFEGSLTGNLSVGHFTIEEPSLAIAIHTSGLAAGSGFKFKFAGRVSISDKHKAVDDTAADRLAAVADNIEAGKAAPRKTRENLQERRVALRAHAQKTIEGLRVQETAFERERAEQLAAARAKNDPLKTGGLDACSADVKLRAYRHLKDCISGADAALLTPLRFAVNVMGKGLNELLNVKSIVLNGSLSDTSGRVKAAVSCTVGGYDWDWSLEIDLGDFVSFFNRL